MVKLEALKKYIPELETGNFGEWADAEDGGTVHFPFVIYSQVVNQFRYDLFGFCEDHPEYEHTAYIEILSELGTEPLECADVSMFDAKVIIAMLVGACRAERFCDVALLGFMENGAIILWLRRLKEIDASAKAVRMVV